MNKETPKKLTPLQIKKLTPYIDKAEIKLTPRQRAFCWFYTQNGFNGSQACKMAGYKSKKSKHGESFVFAQQAQQNLNLPYVLESIKLIIKNSYININRSTLEKRLFETWVVQAFYDPGMFINPDGRAAFKSWDEIPEEYRVCVEGIEQKYNKDCGFYIILKLADRKVAQDKLDKYIQMTKESHEVEFGDNTINSLKDTLEKFMGKKDESNSK